MPPRVLFLSRRFLFPLDTGGKIRTARTLEALRERWDVTVIGGYRPNTDDPAAMTAIARRFIGVAEPEPDTGWLRRQARRLRHATAGLPLTVLYARLRGLPQAVKAELDGGGYDLFVCDFLQSAVNVPWPCPVPAVLFTHNVESRITRRHAEMAEGFLSRVFWRSQHRLMTRYEGDTAGRFDGVIAVSDSDRDEFEKGFHVRNVRTVPTGIDLAGFRPSGEDPEPGHIVFCGSMDWVPNQDAVRWFAREILPLVQTSDTRAHLTVVGRHPPVDLVNELARSTVTFSGWVDDVRPFLYRAACVVVPIRIGGGTRIKIYEAMAMSRPVVSTTIGAEGLDLTPGAHFRSADDPSAFADAVAWCLGQPHEAAQMAEAARQHVALRYGWDKTAAVFAEVAEGVLRSGRT